MVRVARSSSWSLRKNRSPRDGSAQCCGLTPLKSYLYRGLSSLPLYHNTKLTLSGGCTGVRLHGRDAVPPSVASANSFASSARVTAALNRNTKTSVRRKHVILMASPRSFKSFFREPSRRGPRTFSATHTRSSVKIHENSLVVRVKDAPD